ncbi:outer membrane beta-barrel protein [Cognatitamlana onchidii]|uniref:outer membrane beta-barrel protein n=1 Tax=Cognatitamlana onchidii TaxID=2562860 RepID=UPI0010A5D2A6|nr:outer membrane beta-barrel protein [Algibacter onchidii]
MILKFKNNPKKLLWVMLCFCSFLAFSQNDTRTIKAQFGLGINSPSQNGFVDGFQSNAINFPTVNLGLQYMFASRIGAKLDLGFNRFSNADNSMEFKTNYTRINGQLVYDLSGTINISRRIGTFVHAGPGISIIKPLGNYGANNTSFLNAVAGVEVHYGISEKLSLYLDTSYIFGFGKEFNPVTSGFGSFNGNLLTVTIGANISLSGCYYCGD